MKTKLKIALAITISLVLFQCSSFKKTPQPKDGKVNGTYKLSMLTSSTEGFTLNVKNPNGTYREAIALLQSENPEFLPDSSMIKSKIERELENLSKFTMTFSSDNSYSQSAFVMDDTLMAPFSGKYQVTDNQMVLSTPGGKLFDRYEYFEQSKNSITLIQKEYEGDELASELIFILEKVN